jgi:hypothetical protein
MAAARKSPPPVIGTTKKRRSHSKTTPKKTTRRRRVGAIGGSNMKNTVMLVVGSAGGVFLGRMLKNMLKPADTSKTDNSHLIIAAAGAGAAMFLKNPIIKSVGIGMAGYGLNGFIKDSDVPSLGGSKVTGMPYTNMGNAATTVRIHSQSPRLLNGSSPKSKQPSNRGIIGGIM